jgi:hypothetical protein
VASKTAQGFEIRERKGGTSTIPFRYRVVARRADPVGTRLEKVDIPGAPDPTKQPRSPLTVEPKEQSVPPRGQRVDGGETVVHDAR